MNTDELIDKLVLLAAKDTEKYTDVTMRYTYLVGFLKGVMKDLALSSDSSKDILEHAISHFKK